MTIPVRLAVIMLAALVHPLACLAKGEWPRLRGNGELTNRTKTPGEIQEPTIAWSKYLGPWTAWVTVDCTHQNRAAQKLPLPPRQDTDPREKFAAAWGTWGLTTNLFDLTGDGTKRLVDNASQAIKVARVLEDRPGMQEIRAVEVRHPTDRNGHATTLALYSYDKGPQTPVELWKVQLYRFHERPHVLAADMSGDSRKEVILSGWQGVTVHDANDGRQLMVLPQEETHTGRKRGYVQARDLDGDGKCEIVIIGEVANHVQVFRNEGGKKLSVAWFKAYDTKVATQNRITRSIPASVEDYDGSGTFEVVYNLWNEKDDGQWHVKSLDALTGREVFDLPGAFIQDAIDLDGDGRLEMLCTRTTTLGIPVVGSIAVYSFGSHGVEQRWSLNSASWTKTPWINESAHIATHSGRRRERVLAMDVDGSGKPAVFVEQVGKDGTTIRAYHMQPAKRSMQPTAWRLHAPPNVEVSLYPRRPPSDVAAQASTAGSHQLLARFRVTDLEQRAVAVKGATCKLEFWLQDKPDQVSMPIVADLDGDGVNEIIVRDGLEHVVCLERTDRGGPRVRWSAPGAGMANQYNPTIDWGVAAYDVEGSGRKDVLVRRPGRTGSVLASLRPDGTVRWEREFPEIQAGYLDSSRGNMAFWHPGKFTAGAGEDVVVTVQKHIQHTGRTYALDGRDGRQLWGLEDLRDGPITSGAGGYPLVVADVTGDGMTEVLTGNGNIVWCADGCDGRIRFARFMRGLWAPYLLDKTTEFWIFAVLPYPLRRADGAPVFFCANAGIGTGLMSNDGRLLWANDDISTGARSWQTLANLDGDGKLWVIEPCARNDMRILQVYDPMTGDAYRGDSTDASFKLGAVYSKNPLYGYFTIGGKFTLMPLAVDIDSDGRDNVLLNLGNKLICLSWRGGCAHVDWQQEFPDDISPPIAADVSGGGHAEILVSCQDGRLYCIGDKRQK